MMSSWHKMILAAGLGLPEIDQGDHPAERDCVVLLHGLARTPQSMRIMQWALENRGYRVVNLGYASRRGTIATLAEEAFSRAVPACGNAPVIHIVTHSLGGILLRHWVAHNPLPRLGRAVLLGPPNGGSEIVDALQHWTLFARLNGPAGRQLGTKSGPDLHALPDGLPFETAIIAGNRSVNSPPPKGRGFSLSA